MSGLVGAIGRKLTLSFVCDLVPSLPYKTQGLSACSIKRHSCADSRRWGRWRMWRLVQDRNVTRRPRTWAVKTPLSSQFLQLYMNIFLATRRVFSQTNVKLAGAAVCRRHASFYNADIAGLTDEQVEVLSILHPSNTQVLSSNVTYSSEMLWMSLHSEKLCHELQKLTAATIFRWSFMLFKPDVPCWEVAI